MDFESKSPRSRKGYDHERYEELCALFTSGGLTDAEQTELNSHLLDCKQCAKIMLEYRAVAKAGAALLAPLDEVTAADAEKPWSVENAKKQLFNRIEAAKATKRREFIPETTPTVRRWMTLFVPRRPAWLGAALLVLMAALSAFSYHLGQLRGPRTDHQTLQPTTAISQPPQIALPMAATHDQLLLGERLAAESREVQKLELELKRQMAAVSESRLAQEKLQHEIEEKNSLAATLTADKATLAGERDAVGRKLQEAQSALVSAQQRLDNLQEEQNRQLLRAVNLQRRVDELTADLKDRLETHEEKLSASDQDVRELMGARDLYIADVFDVDRDGKTRKPFGRVFYTGGRSLVFYAFDLDRQPGAREAVTFQAWGRRGPGDKHPFNMGTLSLDNPVNRRWALHFDDPKILAELDAVFVTLEPRSGAQKPTGKQLLFASLRIPANHP